MRLDIGQLTQLQYAIDDVVGYLTDNYCGDPDCCGGPFFNRNDYKRGLSILGRYGIEVVV